MSFWAFDVIVHLTRVGRGESENDAGRKLVSVLFFFGLYSGNNLGDVGVFEVTNLTKKYYRLKIRVI